MPKIIEYVCIRAYHQDDLTKSVNELLSEGWQPFGSVATSANTVQADGTLEPGTWRCFVQAMVLYAEDSK